MLDRKKLAARKLFVEPGADVKTLAVRSTSGTSGNLPVVTIRRITDLSSEYTGLRKMKRPLICIGPFNHKLNLVLGALYSRDVATEAAMLVEAKDLDSSLEHLCADFRADLLRGNFSFISRVLEHVQTQEVRQSIRYASFAGEAVSNRNITAIQKKLPKAQFFTSYAASELGGVGKQPCAYLEHNWYHPGPGFRVAVINVAAGGIGDLVISRDREGEKKIDRYLVGDSGRIRTERCPCGAAVTFEVMGRTHFEYIKLAGATLYVDEFERVAELLSGYYIDYRTEAREKVVDGHLYGSATMDVVPTEKLQAHKDPERFLAGKIAKTLFVTPTQTYQDLVNKDLFLPLSVHFVTAFPEQHKVVKLRKVD